MDVLPRFACRLGLLLAGGVVACAQLPQLVLNHVFPAGTAVGATNEVTVNAAVSNFSGIVRCDVLQATTVVASTYTPGAGNIW